MLVGAGLRNLGNTCFFNAALQTILHTEALSKILAGRAHSELCRKSQWCVFCEVEKIHEHTKNTRVYSPEGLIRNLSRIFKKFKLGRQEDSHEFLRYLIEGMQEAETGKLGKDRQANEIGIRHTNIFAIFGGISKTVVECLHCHQKSLTQERYYDFNIECQRSNSLQEGLKDYFAVDQLNGNNKYNCERCLMKSNAIKRTFLQTVPQVVTFQLKRFTNFMRKIGKFIAYPLKLDLGVYLEQPRKIILKLYGIIVHAGGSSYSGHYYSFIRVDDSWFRMDDSYVSKATLDHALQQNAYVLLYQKVDQELPKCVKEQRQKAVEQLPQNKQTSSTSVSNITNGIQHERIPHSKLTLEQDTPKQRQIISKPIPKQPQITPMKQLARAKPSSQSQQQSQLEVPQTLQQTKSKEEVQKSMSPQMLIMKLVTKLIKLKSKTPKHKPINRSLRRIYNLRVYQGRMLRKKQSTE